MLNTPAQFQNGLSWDKLSGVKFPTFSIECELNPTKQNVGIKQL